MISIFMYHQVGAFPEPASHRQLYCDAGRFRRQVAWLKALGFESLTPQEAARRIREGIRTPRGVAFTFDDGYQSFADFAWPILREAGFKATVFLVTRRLGADRAELDGWTADAPFLAPETILRLRKEGVTFGAHTRTHRHLQALPEEQQREEIAGSKADLEALLGEEVPDFCYPAGKYGPETLRLVREAGFTTACTCNRGAAEFAPGPLELPRKTVSWRDGPLAVLWKAIIRNKLKSGYNR